MANATCGDCGTVMHDLRPGAVYCPTCVHPTGGQPAPEAVVEAIAETFGNVPASEWKAMLELDWKRDKRLFSILVAPGVNAPKVFQVAWEAGFRAALELRAEA